MVTALLQQGAWNRWATVIPSNLTHPVICKIILIMFRVCLKPGNLTDFQIKSYRYIPVLITLLEFVNLWICELISLLSLLISYILCFGVLFSLEKICKQNRCLCEKMNICPFWWSVQSRLLFIGQGSGKLGKQA